MFAANLRPKETFLAKNEINSMSTSSGNNPRGQPLGTKREKNPSLCSTKPSMVHPKTTLKLMKKVRIKCEVGAKLYGTIPIKLLTSMKTSKQ